MSSFRQYFRGQSLLFLTLSMFTGLIGAFMYPVMSYFLVEGLGAPPVYIGLYTVAVTISGLFISQWMGGLADKGLSARRMYIIAVSGLAIAIFCYAHAPNFWWVLAAGVMFMSLGNASVPQMLTLGRQWASTEDINITEFNSLIRAAISLAWIGGPPLAFTLVAWLGFSGSFYTAVAVAVISILFVVWFIPEKNLGKRTKIESERVEIPLSFWMLGGVVTCGMLANVMYSSALPLYTLKELRLPDHVPGILMGLVAGLEIPVMILASRLAKFFKKGSLMAVSFVCAMTFYIGVFYATEFWQLVVLQFANAIFYGLFAGLGLTLMQDQLPERIGFTSAFYSNAMKVGMMIGSTGTGLIAQFFSFRFAALGALAAAALGLTFLMLFKQLRKQERLQISLLSSSKV